MKILVDDSEEEGRACCCVEESQVGLPILYIIKVTLDLWVLPLPPKSRVDRHAQPHMAEYNLLLCSNLQFPRALTVILSHRTLGYLPHVIEASTGLERLRALAKVTQRREDLSGTSGVLSLFLSFLLLFLLA